MTHYPLTALVAFYLLMNISAAPSSPITVCLPPWLTSFGTQPATYALEGSVAITGALVQWLRDNLGLIKTSADIESWARMERDNGGGMVGDDLLMQFHADLLNRRVVKPRVMETTALGAA